MNVQYKWKIKDKFNHRQYIYAKIRNIVKNYAYN